METEESVKEQNEDVLKSYQPIIKKRKISGVPIIEITPKDWKDNGKLLVYTHGGAYTLFSAASTLYFSVPVADATGLRVISIDYTTAPFAKWKEITDQVISVFKALIKDGHQLENLALWGDSAGGSLACGSVLKMRNQGIGMPAAVVLWSPWSDITETGDTYATLKDADPILNYSALLKPSADAYADPKDQKNPYVSPVYGNYKPSFPPTLIQVGTKEIFLSNAIRQYHKLDDSGQEVKLDPYEGMWHDFQGTWTLPESKLAREKTARFLKKYMKH